MSGPTVNLNLKGFEQAMGVRVSMSQISTRDQDFATAIQFEPTTAAATGATLVIIYDLSDSCGSTIRLLGRLPDLLRGWWREMPVWTYSLSNDQPLPLNGGLKIGHILDNPTTLTLPLDDTRLISRHRRQGSFLQPPIEAIASRARDESVSSLYVVFIGDALLTDFEPVPIPQNAEFVAIVENVQFVSKAAKSWSQVVRGGAASLRAFDDPQLKVWFEKHGDLSRASRLVRLESDSSVSAFIIDQAGNLALSTTTWFDLHSNGKPVRIVLRAATTPVFSFQYRRSRHEGSLAVEDLHDVPSIPDTDRMAFTDSIRKAIAKATNVLFDSNISPEKAQTFWSAAIRVCKSSDVSMVEDLKRLRRLIAPQEDITAAIIFSDQQFTPVAQTGNRLIVLGLPSTASKLTWSVGEPLPIGRINQSYVACFDQLEDRWAIARSFDGGSSHKTLLERVVLQSLSPVISAAGITWHAQFLDFSLLQ